METLRVIGHSIRAAVGKWSKLADAVLAPGTDIILLKTSSTEK
jgi:hypothetical protein